MPVLTVVHTYTYTHTHSSQIIKIKENLTVLGNIDCHGGEDRRIYDGHSGRAEEGEEGVLVSAGAGRHVDQVHRAGSGAEGH